MQFTDTHTLSSKQIDDLISAFNVWRKRKPLKRNRYWLIFLVLRYTGARMSEVISLNCSDIDFEKEEIKFTNDKKKKQRIIPVPKSLIDEILSFKELYKKDDIFHLDRAGFYRTFHKRCEEAGIPKELAHPHILRHTRAIELLRAGVPVTVVQDILGHSALTTTAVYLRMSGQETKEILREKGLI